MNEELRIAELILSDIIDNDVDFSESLKQYFVANAKKRDLRPMVSGLVGCELRHHLLFEYLLNQFKDKLSTSETRFASLCMANHFFFKRIDDKTLENEMLERLGEEKHSLVKPLFEMPTKSLIPEYIKAPSQKYLSLRYNTPEWVLKIWKHFGYGTTFKILKKNNEKIINSVRVRTSKCSQEALLNNNQNYAKSSIDSILFYGGKEPLRKLDEFKNEAIFPEKPAIKFALDKFELHNPDQIFCYCGDKSDSLIYELIESYGDKLSMNIGVSDQNAHINVKKYLLREDKSNINYFCSSPDNLLAHISSPQELVIALPESTNFDLIREKPDYLIHFKKENMDALFKQEKDVLENCSKYVAEGGKLLYMIYTVSMKEGENTIKEFLEMHNEFKLVKMEQKFPFDEHETCLFYAIMQKDSQLLKAGLPINEIGVSSPSKSQAVSASQGE